MMLFLGLRYFQSTNIPNKTAKTVQNSDSKLSSAMLTFIGFQILVECHVFRTQAPGIGIRVRIRLSNELNILKTPFA